jgi:hypothetical protein
MKNKQLSFGLGFSDRASISVSLGAIAVALLTATSLIPFSAKAADGSSGCGPGWYLFKDNSLVSSALRNITNQALLPVVTVGMTVGSSNCAKHSIVQNEKRSLHLITHNEIEIRRDIAAGGGATVLALTETLGCPVQARAATADALKRSFNSIYAPGKAAGPEATLQRIYEALLVDRGFASACGLTS